MARGMHLSGRLSVVFSVRIIPRPAEGTLPVVYLIANWAIMTGLLRIFFVFRIRRIGNRAGSLAGRTG